MFIAQFSRKFCISRHHKPVWYAAQDICDLSFLKLTRRCKAFSKYYQSSSVLEFSRNSRQLKLSPQEVTDILRHNEQILQLREENQNGQDEASLYTPTMHAIASADSNQLAANSPIEDKLAISRCLLTTGFLFGVFDGHGGPECSQVVSKRLFDYVAASLLPRSELGRIIAEYEQGKKIQLTKVFNDTTEFLPELQRIYDASFLNWCKRLFDSPTTDFSMENALSNSFLQLDKDIGEEVLENKDKSVFPTLLRVATSGSVACIAHVDGPHLHIASCGDCGALIGEAKDEPHGGWVVNRLTRDHNWENQAEVKRILSEHPKTEKDTIIQGQRLLGMLMPFRAFGDVGFKWERELQMDVNQSVNSLEMPYIRHCHTPPYLTAKPEVIYQRLRPQEKFLILASDGLWESMNPLDIVTLVGEYMSGRQTLQPVHLPSHKVPLGEVSRILRNRQVGLRLKPSDRNASTHLIRHCLGGTDEGVDHLKLSKSLTLPPDVRRHFRDDISIHVIFFDTNFLRVCPIEV